MSLPQPLGTQLRVMKYLFKGIALGRGLKVRNPGGFERLVAAIYGTPDRVPILAQPYTYAMSMHGLEASVFFSKARPFIGASFNFARYFDIDFWSPVFDFYNIEAEALGQRLIWRKHSEPDVDTSQPLIKSEDDLKRLRPPVPGVSGRMPFVLESYKRYIELMGIPPMVYACSPFTMAVLLRGYVNFIRDIRRNPRFAHRLLDFLSMEVVVPWIEKMVETTTASIVVMSDAWASQPNVTTDMVREFCLPYIEKIVKATNSSLRTVVDTGSWGECSVGDPREVLDIKYEMITRGNFFKSLRPLFLLVWNEDYEKIGIVTARRYAEEKSVCLMLNVRPNLIEEGPPEAIVSAMRKIIREGAGRGKFVIIMNLIPVASPLENVFTVVESVKQFGSYPISDEIETIPFRPPAFMPFSDWFRREGLPLD